MTWADRLRTTTMDEDNDSAVNLIYIDPGVTNPHAAALGNAMSAMSVGHQALVARETAITGPDIESGGAGSYPTHRDMITLMFQTVLGASVSYTQAAPKASTLQGDMKTVNPLNADVANAIANIKAYATDSAGNAIAEYRRGWRWYFDE